jgi:hypothetical protein
MDEATLREKADVVFSAAMPPEEPLEFPPGETSQAGNTGSQSIHIQNMYLQAEDCQTLLDFLQMIMHSVNRPEEVPV